MIAVFRTVHTWGEMVRFSHSIFALPFAFVGAFLAGRHIDDRGWPYWGQLGLIVICMVSARSVAMTFNRIIDLDIDARNPRTAQRPLPAGRLSLWAAWVMLGLSVVTFGFGCVGFHVWYDNTLPVVLSGPVLLVLCGYSFTKRFTRWSHYYLGSAIALSPVAAWVAIDPGSTGLEAMLLMLAVAFWIAGFDIIYACQDIEVDRRDGLHSLPSRIGPTKALWIARCSHGVTIVALIVLGVVADLGWLYASGVGIVSILLVVENSLVHPGDYRRVNLAFFTINGIVSVVLAVMAIGDVLMTAQARPG
jgi:4-hydroxybenzoate polyprenyltransferase